MMFLTPLCRFPCTILLVMIACYSASISQADEAKTDSAVTSKADGPELFRRDNLVAWCIVPFDDRERSPEDRAAMLRRLGLSRFAYDYRAQHVPTFDAEIEAMKKHGVELTAWWFPGVLNDEARHTLAVFERHDVHPQLWITGSGAPTNSPAEQQARIKAEAERIRPIAEAAAAIGCRVELYNHGGWFGEPENQIAIIKALNLDHVGIVYNLHHGHGHLDRFPELLQTMLPYLDALNLNGMVTDGDRHGMKIVPIGEGEHDLTILKTIAESGYDGPIGILNHTSENAEHRLQDNLDGLDWLVPQLSGEPAGQKKELRTWKRTTVRRPGRGTLLDGLAEYRTPPLTVDCMATLTQSQGFNILVASDEKRSGTHWELFTMAGSGRLTAYLPGMQPDHANSSTNVCDGKPHRLRMTYAANRVRLYVDGEQVADQVFESRDLQSSPGGLGIGRLVEGRLGHHGEISSVDIWRGIHPPDTATPPADSLVLRWRSPAEPADSQTSQVWEYSPSTVANLAADAMAGGDARQGVMVFSSAKFACISCHKVGAHGGTVGPDLSKLGTQRTPEQIVESLYWPKREVKPEYVAHHVLTADGKVFRGYRVSESDELLVLRDPATHAVAEISIDDIDDRREAGTLMPEGLIAAMTPGERRHVVRFLTELGREGDVKIEALDDVFEHAMAHVHGAASFPFDRDPLHPNDWPNWQHEVNRDRIYDFYAKEAAYFRGQPKAPPLVMEFPGLDGGEQGHWGNQNEVTWTDDRWNDSELGSVQAGVFRGNGLTVPRAVCIRLGEHGELSACFNPDTLTYDAVWNDGFVKFSSVRHGFMHGLLLDGTPLPKPTGTPPTEPFQYLGFYRVGPRIVFSYRMGDTEYLDSPWVEKGEFIRTFAPASEHPLASAIPSAVRQWPQVIETNITHGAGSPYAVDTIELPTDNPWSALIFCGGHAFDPETRTTYVCTMQGDVWRVEHVEYPAKTASWTRFASGLHFALGMVIDADGIFVLCRDQITRLHDLNHDGEADFYECFSNAYETSPAGHDYICGLQRDPQGRFYLASGNQGLVRVSRDGRNAEVLATGFRNPDGLGLAGDGTVTVPCSEGEWTPASMICAIRPDAPTQPSPISPRIGGEHPAYFGYGGPHGSQAPELPLVYLPRGLDNSSGGQTEVVGDRWGLPAGQMLHFSFGTGSHFQLLRDEVDGQMQGGIVPLPGEFLSGAHRGKFNPHDGQLYVSGMAGWGSYTLEDGCFQRVRYTGESVLLPTGFHVHQNGIKLSFTSPVDPDVVADGSNRFAQCWNYRYGPGYGSAEFSTRHLGMRGHDVLKITSAHVVDDGLGVFLEIPDLQPANQVHLQVLPTAERPIDMFLTVHRLDEPFTQYPGYRAIAKEIVPHPILADLARTTESVPNPWTKRLTRSREVVIETGSNLTFKTRSFEAVPGETIELTLVNPDVVPHNWALLKPGTLERVGRMANRLISDPDAVVRQYIPETDDVLTYTNVVSPGDEFKIYFRAPEQPGRYPYLCTFPGHWLVMNGELIVRPKK